MAAKSLSYKRCIEAASIALASGDQANAELALRAAIRSVQGVEGSQPELVDALVKLAKVKQEADSHWEADELFRQALGVGERCLGKDHPDLVILINDLTRLYLKQSAYGSAEPLLLRLLEIKRTKGEDHPEVATVLASLAVVRQGLGRHESAEQLCRRVLSIRERTLAPNHFAIATALEHLAETCAARGKVGEAVMLCQRALMIRETTLGRDHPSLRESRERIADLELQRSEEPLEPIDTGVTTSLVTVPRAPLATPRPLDRIAAPTPAGLEMMAIKPTPLPPVSYLDTLRDISSEIGDMELAEASLEESSGSLVRAVRGFLSRRRAVAAVAGLGVIALPMAAWGIAGARSRLRFVENPVAPGPARVAPAPTPGPSDFGVKPATARTERNSGAKAAGTTNPLRMALGAAPPPTVREDLVRGMGAPFDHGSESVLRHLPSSAELRPGGVAPARAPVRARLIGSLPTPRYPRQLIRARTVGEVRVRFDVDTLGRPVMSTFTVVSAPRPQLAKAVRDVIPGIRFEPARTPWPENRPVVETVELAFRFVLPGNK